ncbi:MAG: hypothetical protein ABI948_12140 [Thermoleophilia bacterium]
MHPDNVVATGGLAPVTINEGGIAIAVGPLMWMRKLLCLPTANRPLPDCPAVCFDAWATHPYT